MAEIIGVVSSAITLAEATAKTCKGIIALKRLWNEVHEVPEYINALLDRLALVHSVLSEMEIELNRDQQLLKSNSAIGLSLQYCKSAKDRLDALVDELKQRVEDKGRFGRNRARVKAVIGKEVVRQLQDEIRDAMQLLGISQQTYAIALARQQPALIVDQIGSLSAGPQTWPSVQNSTLPRKSMQTTSAASMIVPKGSLRLPWTYSIFGSYSSRSTGTFSSADEVYCARIQLPAWLFRSVWDIRAKRASNGWTYTLQQWSVRPHGAEVFGAALDGDLPAIIPLFNDRKASLFDRDPRGWTLLHYAAFQGNLETITYLIRSGLSIHETSTDGSSPLYYLCRNSAQASDVLNIYRLIESTDDLSDAAATFFLPRDSYYDKSTLHRFIWSVPGLFNLVTAESHLVPLETRFTTIIWRYVNPKVLLDILVRENVVDAEIVRRQLHGAAASSLHEFAKVYFQHVPGGPNSADPVGQRMGTVFEDWRKLAQWLFGGMRGRDLVRQGNQPWEATTPLFSGLMDCGWAVPRSRREVRRAERRLETALMFWLEDLQSTGVDLARYGRREQKTFEEGYALRRACWKILACGEEGPRLASIEFGPLPRDWKLGWSHLEGNWCYLEEDVVGVFFEWAGCPPPVMPGSWLDEEV
ncbi:hypothetical protein PENPOL_c003G07857 [Penicillium polonicum]|uniref:NACHT-NTPase and P-loop NTPases N-terminal domain-containing protein n=1 Tax=Penicillium polonicum TaxID=60169 RepID=A0A1V6NT57_PENPO|nr:hypothetical protein PENPOL_c003G07857 [Penicillium polonicum]